MLAGTAKIWSKGALVLLLGYTMNLCRRLPAYAPPRRRILAVGFALPSVARAQGASPGFWATMNEQLRELSKGEAALGVLICGLFAFMLFLFMNSKNEPGEVRPVFVPAMLFLGSCFGVLMCLVRLIFLWP